MPESSTVDAPPARSLSLQEIRELLPHRYPMLLIDRVDLLEPGVRIEAVKCVTANDPFMVGHFPDYPIMPGVLIVDALAQAAGIMLRAERSASSRPERVPEQASGGQPGVLASIPKMRFLSPALPGDRLTLRVSLKKGFASTHLVTAEADVDGRLVAVGELVLSS